MSRAAAVLRIAVRTRAARSGLRCRGATSTGPPYAGRYLVDVEVIADIVEKGLSEPHSAEVETAVLRDGIERLALDLVLHGDVVDHDAGG